MNAAWYDIVGAAGVGAIVTAYALLQTGRLDSTRPAYSVLNGAGAAAILVSLWYDFNLPSFVVEAFWLVISLYGIGRYLRGRGGRS